MRTLRLIPLILILALWPNLLQAQGQEALIAQYWAMPTLYNPASTGTTDFIRIRGDMRLQWLGIDNSPKTFSATADSPLKFGKTHIGLGVALQQESLGLFSDLDIGLQASYKLRLFGGQLSIGVQGAYISSKFKGSEVILPDDDDYHEGTDEAIPTQDLTGGGVDLSAGVEWRSKYLSLGISGRHLLDPTIGLKHEGTDSGEAQEYETKRSRTLYFTAQGNIPVKNTLFELQPSLILASDFHDFTGLVDLRARYNRFLSFGLGYRYLAGLNVSLGVEVKNFFLAYSYEYPLSAIAKASSGSHEITAGYQLKLDFSQKNKNRHRSIRLM